MPTLGHCWSLSLEEQFYLLWPPLLYLLLRARLPHWGTVLVVCGLIVGSAGWRAVLYAHKVNIPRLYASLDTRGDALMCGCLTGLFAAWGLFPRRRSVRLGLGIMGGLFLAALPVFATSWNIGQRHLHYGGFTLIGLSTSALLGCLLSGDFAPLRAALEWKPLAGLGRISYGVYLAHIPIMYFLEYEKSERTISRDLVVIALTLTAALLLHFLVERPCLRLRNRLSPHGQSQALLRRAA
jgi:peptidoglycan/LPS O-acetylase OafA/YrhL